MEKQLDSVSLSEMAFSDVSEMDGKYLTFWTDKQLFAIPIADVIQIIGVQEITQIPEFPSYAKGIIHLRGSVIPVIDIRLRFGKDEISYDDHTCIIVTNVNGVLIGFIVDSVNEVTYIENDEISQPPAIAGGVSSSYLTGIAKHSENVILLLDSKRLISDDQLAELSQAI